MSDETQILLARQPVLFEARNPRPGYKRLKAGDIFLLNCEVDEETWRSLKTIPDSAMLHVILYWHDGDTPAPDVSALVPKAEKPKKEKGEFGQYWRCFFKPNADGASAIFCPDLIQSLALEDAAITAEGVKLALREALDVQSLSREASPELFERLLYELHLDGFNNPKQAIRSDAGRGGRKWPVRYLGSRVGQTTARSWRRASRG